MVRTWNDIPAAHADDVTVYGQLDAASVATIDRVADQMLMPRSWVVGQILREWRERRSSEIEALEQSWNDSYREQLGERATDVLQGAAGA